MRCKGFQEVICAVAASKSMGHDVKMFACRCKRGRRLPLSCCNPSSILKRSHAVQRYPW